MARCPPARRIARRASALASAAMLVGAIGGARVTEAAVLPDTLYGVASSPDGSRVVTIQAGDRVAPLPGEAGLFQDLAFDASGRLFATTTCPEFPGGSPSCDLVSPSLLVELDPETGAVVRTIGPVTDASGFQPIVAALTAQPGTGLLYAVDLFTTGIWTIDASTAVATRLPSLRNLLDPAAASLSSALSAPAAAHLPGNDRCDHRDHGSRGSPGRPVRGAGHHGARLLPGRHVGRDRHQAG